MALTEQVISFIEAMDLSEDQINDKEYLLDLLEFFQSWNEMEIDIEYYAEIIQKRNKNIWIRPLTKQS